MSIGQPQSVNKVNGLTGNVVLAAADVGAVDKTGDTMTGDLTLQSVNTTNGTKRLFLQSYDATSDGLTDYSEVIRADFKTNDAKAAIAFRDTTGTSQFWIQAHDYLHYYFTVAVASVSTGTSLVTTSTAPGVPTGWRVSLTSTGTVPSPLVSGTAYYVRPASSTTFAFYPTSTDATNDTNKVALTTTGSGTITFAPDNEYNYNHHKHLSIEASDSNGLKQTRFSIRYGYDITEIETFNANFNVQGGVMRIRGDTGTNRQLLFTNTPANTYIPPLDSTIPRWGIMANSTSESGSNVGSDFKISRFADNGGFIDDVFFIKRSTGDIGIGNSTNTPSGRLHVVKSSDATILRIENTGSSNNAGAILLVVGTSASRILQAGISTDTTQRFSIEASGKHEWGPGGSTARDTNLYRNGVGQLRTDNVFMPQQAATASAPTYVKGGMYFDTTLNKLRIGGATAWETVTSS